MKGLLVSFHGGTTKKSINNILVTTPDAVGTGVLMPSGNGVMPALCELRGFTFDAGGNLYVANSYKNFSQILVFSPSGSGQLWIFAEVLCGGSDSQLAHPFAVVLSPDRHIYVSNQDSNEITYYEGLGLTRPGKLKGVFASNFTTIRGLANDGKNWYVADEGSSSVAGSVLILDSSGKRTGKSLAVNQPVHLLYDGSRYLYIGSEKDNSVYVYDTQGSSYTVTPYVKSTATVPIDATSGLAISAGNLYVGSRKGNSINQYVMGSSLAGTIFVSGLADNPEFVFSVS